MSFGFGFGETKEAFSNQHSQSSYLLECMMESSAVASQILTNARLSNPEFVTPDTNVKSVIGDGRSPARSSDGYDDLESQNSYDYSKSEWNDNVEGVSRPALHREITSSPLYQNKYGFLPLGLSYVLVNNDFTLMNTWIKYYFDTNSPGRNLKRRYDNRMLIMSGTTSGIVNYADGTCDVSFNSYFISQSVYFCDEIALLHLMSRKKTIPGGNILSAVCNDIDAACTVVMQYFPKPIGVQKEEVLTCDSTVYFWPTLERNNMGRCLTWHVSRELPFGLKLSQ